MRKALVIRSKRSEEVGRMVDLYCLVKRDEIYTSPNGEFVKHTSSDFAYVVTGSVVAVVGNDPENTSKNKGWATFQEKDLMWLDNSGDSKVKSSTKILMKGEN